MLKMLHKLKLSSLWKIGVTLTGATFLITFLVWISLATTYQVESHELGHISKVQALNLSHIQLTGSIPETLSNLIDLESLDLSYSSLRREIPPQLIELTILEVFSIAYNNLSGRTPCMKQFGNFGASSYEGNLFLCGLPFGEKLNQERWFITNTNAILKCKWWERVIVEETLIPKIELSLKGNSRA